ncbi:EAL domain-containing protein [Neoaquamicrobium microcysteis]|nr:EAL domain-containing protein [Mesorhizobium microcysteis]
MAKFVSVFISAAHRRLISLLVWALSFAMVLGLIGWYAHHRTGETMRFEARQAAEHFIRLRTNLLSTFDVMHADLTAEPCTPAFNDQLRRIAYLPDGLNEFLYAPGGHAKCSATVAAFDEAVDLGRPDIARQGERGLVFWIDKDLGFLGLQGEKGTIALSEPFAAVVPSQNVQLGSTHWLDMQTILLAADGRWWHRGGERGIYERIVRGEDALANGRIRQLSCDTGGLHCIASEADLASLVLAEKGAVSLALLAAALIASLAMIQTNALIARYWSFDARFRRHLDQKSIVCAYQPVMELESGEITGCEVLARWRDIDDRIVFPDRFIGLIERHHMTLRFTELVARQACAELSENLPLGKRLQVNFNIFPCDLDSGRLARVFSGFTSQPDRFDVVLEIIESDEIPPNAQREIEALRRLGIKTYIDDFGTGYSNMQNLAALSVDGVKLDRAFAMAPDNSMMAQMLRHAVEMIQATGRVMVVEGVETAERLALLRRMQARIDYVQGYFISRPLDIGGFVAFMTPQPVSLAERKKKAGLDIVAA